MRTTAILGAAVLGLAAGGLALLTLAIGHPAVRHPVAGEVVLPRAPHPPPATWIWAIRLDGGTVRLVGRPRGRYEFPVATADGRSLLLLKPSPLGGTSVWSIPVVGGALRRAGRVPVFTRPAWSPERTRLATVDADGVKIFDRSGNLWRTLTRQHGLGGFSMPDWNGGSIAIERESRTTAGWRIDLEVWRASGGRRWRIVGMPFPYGEVAVSPSGTQVAVAQLSRLYVVTRHGRQLLASDTSDTRPFWTPDGRRLVYLDKVGRLVVQDVATRARRIVATRLSAGVSSLSPDGRTVYVTNFGARPAVSIPK